MHIMCPAGIIARRMKRVTDLIEEAKRRSVLLAICVVCVAYCMSLTSDSVWVNIPITIVILALVRRISLELHFRRRTRKSRIQSSDQASHLNAGGSASHLGDSWNYAKAEPHTIKIALDEFVRCVVCEWVSDLWYANITPDQETPEQIRLLIDGMFEEISQRIKRVNLVTLLSEDIVELLGSHLELYRQTHASLGLDIQENLTFEKRDEKIKELLKTTGKLYPALLSKESEDYVLRRIMGGIVAITLRPQNSRCRLVHCLARELLACSVMSPVMNFAKPSLINELIRSLVLTKEYAVSDPSGCCSKQTSILPDTTLKECPGVDAEVADIISHRVTGLASNSLIPNNVRENSLMEANVIGRPQDSNHFSWTMAKHTQEMITFSNRLSNNFDQNWTQILEDEKRIKAQVLAPEHLDNIWTKGRNYRDKEIPQMNSQGIHLHVSSKVQPKGMIKDRLMMQGTKTTELVQLHGNTSHPLGENVFVNTGKLFCSNTVPLEKKEGNSLSSHRRSRSSGADYEGWQNVEEYSGEDGIPRRIKADGRLKNVNQTGLCDRQRIRSSDDLTLVSSTGQRHRAKLQSKVIGAQFVKSGSKIFTVYSILVKDTGGQMWEVRRRYRNFEELHRRLKKKPCYYLQLPPKRFLSSNLDNSFIQERCMLLDKYLKDLLAIPSIAELHEVWDFFSVSSKSYSHGDFTSLIDTIPVNIKNAQVDEFSEVTGNLEDDMLGGLKLPKTEVRQKMSSGTLPAAGQTASLENKSIKNRGLAGDKRKAHQITWDEDEMDVLHEDLAQGGVVPGKLHLGSQSLAGGLAAIHTISLESTKENVPQSMEAHQQSSTERLVSGTSSDSDSKEDNIGSWRWKSPKITVSLLNLLDVAFQLQNGGWLRRQILWVTMQVLQLGMGDAIDDFLMGHVHWLQREDVVAGLIRWIHSALWPDGIFMSKHPSHQNSSAKDIRYQSDLSKVVREIILDGAPRTLVHLIGSAHYRSAAMNMFFFLQSEVCLKQLAYGLLELIVVIVFPELQNLMLEIRRM